MSDSHKHTVINDKLQGTVVTYLRFGGIINNQIQTGLLLSLPVKFFLISEYIQYSYGQKGGLLTTQPHLKYVATLPFNVSLISCFLTLMFHNVLLQNTQDVVRFIITVLLQIY